MIFVQNLNIKHKLTWSLEPVGEKQILKLDVATDFERDVNENDVSENVLVSATNKYFLIESFFLFKS